MANDRKTIAQCATEIDVHRSSNILSSSVCEKYCQFCVCLFEEAQDGLALLGDGDGHLTVLVKPLLVCASDQNTQILAFHIYAEIHITTLKICVLK